MLNKLLMLLSVVSLSTPASEPVKTCAQIFYDAPAAEADNSAYGQITATFLKNLIGHFPAVSTEMHPVESYQKDQIEKCSTNFYIGTRFDNALPETFLADFSETKQRVAWLGYNIWRLGETRVKANWNVAYTGLSSLDWTKTDAAGEPGFFRFYDYKGQTFTKVGEFTKDTPAKFHAAFEISLVKWLGAPGSANIVSTARHSTQTDVSSPYIVRNQNRWLVTDNPLSFMTEDDRYLIFADTLFDMLDQKPRYPAGHAPAFVRVEDIHAKVPVWQLQGIIDLFAKLNIPYGLSVIPVFADPYNVLQSQPGPQHSVLDQQTALVAKLKEAIFKGGSIIFHGASHQYEDLKNPSGVSGFDFEFWNTQTNSPVPLDSSEFVVNRLERALAVFEKAQFKPSAWVTPHYQSSSLDTVIFSQLFSWMIGRVGYAPVSVTQSRRLPGNLNFDSGAKNNGKRLTYFSDLRVSAGNVRPPDGQFFPYEIYSDINGGRIIPENLGYVQPDGGIVPGTLQNTVDRMIARTKRNAVLRDTWASFFIHPLLLSTVAEGGLGEYNGDVRPIERLLQAVSDSGYQFIDLKKWTSDQALTP